MSTIRTVPAVFTSSTTSGAIDLGSDTLVGVELPSGFQGTSLKFQGSNDNATFQDVYGLNEGVATPYTSIQIDVVVAASKSYTFKADFLAGFRWIKLVAGSGSYTVNCFCRSMGGR